MLRMNLMTMKEGAMKWRIDLLPDGRIATLHHDDVAERLAPLGPMKAQRLTDVQFNEYDQAWHVYPAMGACVPVKVCKHFPRRTDAIAHEVATLTQMPDSYGELL
jgi:hypothetical protein